MACQAGDAVEITLDFERPILELERKIEELKQLRTGSIDFSDEIARLEAKASHLREEIFEDLSPWQVVQLSRHPARPYSLDYIAALMPDFLELHGDRLFRDDPAIVAGIATLAGAPLVVIGHQKGRNTRENMHRNFGMPGPEGYRKAKRLMELAGRFRLPIVTLIDTPGAYPGIGAEERGQAEAIAKNLEVMAGLPVPIVSVVIGEGGSGGALALGVANRILMLQFSIYSVISPEGCASILWKDGARAPQAAEVLHLRARDIHELKVADEVIAEPPGGAHRDPRAAAERLGEALRRHLAELGALDPAELVEQRYRKFRAAGVFLEN
jgi:acetyl-CoA carboxylase carboxyl transferase subunit alpha